MRASVIGILKKFIREYIMPAIRITFPVVLSLFAGGAHYAKAEGGVDPLRNATSNSPIFQVQPPGGDDFYTVSTSISGGLLIQNVTPNFSQPQVVALTQRSMRECDLSTSDYLTVYADPSDPASGYKTIDRIIFGVIEGLAGFDPVAKQKTTRTGLAKAFVADGVRFCLGLPFKNRDETKPITVVATKTAKGLVIQAAGPLSRSDNIDLEQAHAGEIGTVIKAAHTIGLGLGASIIAFSQLIPHGPLSPESGSFNSASPVPDPCAATAEEDLECSFADYGEFYLLKRVESDPQGRMHSWLASIGYMVPLVK